MGGNGSRSYEITNSVWGFLRPGRSVQVRAAQCCHMATWVAHPRPYPKTIVTSPGRGII